MDLKEINEFMNQYVEDMKKLYEDASVLGLKKIFKEDDIGRKEETDP